MTIVTNELMLELTKAMPMKQIDIDGEPYLQRYYAGTFADGHDLWLHRFISCDGERHLHCHPFDSRSVIMTGGYVEELPDGPVERPADPSGADRIVGMMALGIQTMHAEYLTIGRVITVYDWHRIASVQPGTWTAFIVKPKRLPCWFFRDETGALEQVRASPRDWWKSFGPRPS